MSKLLASIKEAIEKCELRDGMTISFHHHTVSYTHLTLPTIRLV